MGYRYPAPVAPPVSDAEADDLIDEGLDLLDTLSSPNGQCGTFQVVAGVGGSFSGCRGTVGGERGSIVSAGLAVGLEGGSVGGGAFYTNADSWGQLAGRGTCGSVGGGGGAGGGSMTVCESHSDPGVYAAVLAGEVGPIGLATASGSRTESVVFGYDPVAGTNDWWTNVTRDFFWFGRSG